MEESISGIIEHIIFRNEENGYTVFSLQTDGREETCVGFFAELSEGMSVKLSGRYTEHMAYGTQFKADSYEIQTPDTIDAVEAYLGSGVIKGIGRALAARIVNMFGEDAVRILEEEPERLAEVRGISMRKAREMGRQAAEQADMRKAMVFLQGYGISLRLGVKIYMEYGESMYGILRENPYRLAEDIDGVGFLTADKIAASIGISPDSEYRIRSGMLYTLSAATGEGNIYLPEELFIRRSCELLGVEREQVQHALQGLLLEHLIVAKPEPERTQSSEVREEEPQAVRADRSPEEWFRDMELAAAGMEMPEPEPARRIIYSGRLYYMELNAARMLLSLSVPTGIQRKEAEKQLARMTGSGDISLEEEQREAVISAAMNGVFILTGGPGTGKTTTINEMIRYFKRERKTVLLAAPTGRAAKRMTETTGYEASTIHRLLEVSSQADGEEELVRFERNSENPLLADVVIIDEMSMVDIFLMHALLQALTVGTRLILVGDVDQLPSVGPGAVLRDILRSGAFPSVTLCRIFRQAQASDIVVNAHKINRGEQIALDNKSRDFFFLKRDDSNRIISNMIQLVRDKLPPYVNARPYDIQVLAPMRKGPLGVERLNTILQEYLNPPADKKAEKVYGDITFREGDKVMQTRNNYQLEWEVRGKYGIPVDEGEGIFNGDMGIIREVDDFSHMLLIEFDEGRMVEYPYTSLEDLELAYAVTIHKSQGSEYPAVILPILSGPPMLMTRNLFYTAVTRARSCVVILGSEEAVRSMISNETEQLRFTSLDIRIGELCGYLDPEN